MPDISKSVAEWEKFRTDLCRRLARAPSTPANSAQIFISNVPVTGPAPSLDERIRVTSSPSYRRIEKSRRLHMESAHGL